MTDHFGYKKIQNGFIVKLRIEKDKNELTEAKNNEMRSDIKSCNAPFAKYRCERAFVLDIYHSIDKNNRIDKGYGLYDPTFLYKVGEYVSVEDYDQDVEMICSTGIHYFLSEECAYFWNMNFPKNYTGEYKEWNDNGQLLYSAFYKAGKLDGEEKVLHDNGQLASQIWYKDGLLLKK